MNILICLIIVAVVVIGAYKYYVSLDEQKDIFEEDFVSEYDLAYFVQKTKEYFIETQKRNFEDANLSREELARKNKRQIDLRNNLQKAKVGDAEAKRYIIGIIKDIIVDENEESGTNLNKIVNFDNPEKLTGNQMWTIVLYIYAKKYGPKGLDEMFREWRVEDNWEPDSTGILRPVFSLELLQKIYTSIIEGKSKYLEEADYTLDFNDKLEIVARIIFSTISLGIIDDLYEQQIDEIDGGVSGVPYGSLAKRFENGDKRISYAHDSIWVLYHGLNIQLKCITFGSQREFTRVCNNIYKFNPPGALSEKEGRVLATMIDGSRIQVFRQGFSSSWNFFLRKFDTVESHNLADLMEKDRNVYIPVVLMYWAVTGELNSFITGEQGSGKTTTLASVIRFTNPTYNIRVQEMQFELNLRYTYPDRNIVEIQATDNISLQDGIDALKKTNGTVTIEGEIASAIQASHIIQTAKVGSLYTMSTHHAKTPEDLVGGISDNLLQIGLYKEKNDAVRAVAGVANIDCHMAKIKGKRHMTRISEIVPIETVPYPSERDVIDTVGHFIDDNTDDNGIFRDPTQIAIMDDKFNAYRMKTFQDAPEYFKRMTDPELFSVRQLMHWEADDASGVTGAFVLDNIFSKEKCEEMIAKMPVDLGLSFQEDMEMLQKIQKLGYDTDFEGKTEWINKELAY